MKQRAIQSSRQRPPTTAAALVLGDPLGLAKLALPLIVLAFCCWLVSLDLHREREPHQLHEPDMSAGYAAPTANE